MEYTTNNADVNFDAETDEGQENLLMNESDILKGLLHAAEYNDESNSTTIDITRDGKRLFSFRIRPLSEEEYIKCRDKHTRRKKNKSLGVSMPTDTDTTKYRSQLIYNATVKEDRAKVWDSKAAWNALSVITGIDLIDKVLRPGEKDRVLEVLDDISGYGVDFEDAEETAKN